MNATRKTGRRASPSLKALAIAALALLGAQQALAGCGGPGNGSHSPQGWHDGGDKSPHDSIAGLWKVTFTSDGSAYPSPIPAGVETDFATVQWHPDGTEFMISGGRPPSTGDVCMGVWKPAGARTVKLYHIALAWVSGDSGAAAAAYLGPSIFHETVTLDKAGDTYEGPFTIDQYATDGVTLLEHVAGTVKGTRVSVD